MKTRELLQVRSHTQKYIENKLKKRGVSKRKFIKYLNRHYSSIDVLINEEIEDPCRIHIEDKILWVLLNDKFKRLPTVNERNNDNKNNMINQIKPYKTKGIIVKHADSFTILSKYENDTFDMLSSF